MKLNDHIDIWNYAAVKIFDVRHIVVPRQRSAVRGTKATAIDRQNIS